MVDRAATRRIGFEPRADVLLERSDQSARIWIEFEISRADPVANHAKFATARFLEGTRGSESFVSMTSRHISPGRAALAAGTVMLMRGAGIPAFQVSLLPAFDGETIKRLNALSRGELMQAVDFDIAAEIDRVLEVTSGQDVENGYRIHKVDNHFAVNINARQWNIEISDPSVARIWGVRHVQYFVLDPETDTFAPSKFCAFVPAPASESAATFSSAMNRPLGMKMAIYGALAGTDSRFDGQVARVHLQRRLGYRLISLDTAPVSVRAAFDRWHQAVAEAVPARHPVSVLIPPGTSV